MPRVAKVTDDSRVLETDKGKILLIDGDPIAFNYDGACYVLTGHSVNDPLIEDFAEAEAMTSLLTMGVFTEILGTVLKH